MFRVFDSLPPRRKPAPIYRFSTASHDYYMRWDMVMIKVPADYPPELESTCAVAFGRWLDKVAVVAEDDPEVWEYLSGDRC